jgi:hypothetical protein
MAIDQKEQDKLDRAAKQSAEELVKTQIGMTDKFRALTSTLAENDASLGQTAASLRKNSKDTFVGMLASQRLAKVTAEVANDTSLRRIDLERKREEKNFKNGADDIKRRTALTDKEFKSQKDEIKKRKALNDKIIKSEESSFAEKEKLLNAQVQKQALRGEEEQKDFKDLQVLRKLMQDSEAKGLETVRMANGQMQNMTEAKKVLQEQEEKVQKNHNMHKQLFNDNYEKLESEKNSALEKTNLETKSIDAKVLETKKLHSDEVEKINGDEKALKKVHSEKIEKLDLKETQTREDLEKKLKDSMDDTSGFTGFNDALKDLTSGTIDIGGMLDDVTKFSNNITTVFSTIASVMMSIGSSIMLFVNDPMKYLKIAWGMFTKGMSAMAKGFIDISKKMMRGVLRLAVSSATLVAGMLATAASILFSGIVMLAPAILIGLAIAGLIFGIMYLAKKFEENKEMIMFKWGLIQEAFSIAIAGLILWKDKAVSFISNTFKSIWLSIKSLFSAVLTGIENGINFAIQGINSFLPERFQIDEVDIGAKGMAAGLNEEKAAFAVEKEKEAVEFAERKDVLETRTEVMKQAFIDGPPPKTGEDIAVATTEVKQGEKQGNQVNVVNTSSSPTTVSNTQVHTGSGSPRDTDRTAVGLNAIAV